MGSDIVVLNKKPAVKDVVKLVLDLDEDELQNAYYYLAGVIVSSKGGGRHAG